MDCRSRMIGKELVSTWISRGLGAVKTYVVFVVLVEHDRETHTEFDSLRHRS